MRQETNNTFDQGLNKDLNPIVTPNNVLTDCLNGAFITFNGDELTLQNDSGNTKIPVSWDKRMLIDYKEGDSYNENIIVKLEDGSLYKSLTDENIKPVFNEDGELNKGYWELFDPTVKLSKGFYPIGIKEYGGVLYIVSANKETNKVEFGSYPAPMYGKHALYNADEIIKIVNPTEDLYKSRVLNDVFFKSGGYILFDSKGDVDITNLSTLTETKIYKARLLHKLNNGIFDLTEDVWEKFEEYKKKEDSLDVDHWIISGTKKSGKTPFKYFCPNQFRGKLSIVIELDEPKDFSFAKLPQISLGSEDYKLNFEVDYESSENIPIEGFKGIITYENGDIKEISGNKEEIDISLSKDRKSISYEIYPDTPYEWEVFPEEFKDKFALKGSLLLEERYHSLYYELAMGDCDISNSFRTYKMLILSNANGPLGLDMENVREGEKLTVFTLDGFDMPNKEDYNILGKFDISDNKAFLIGGSLNTSHFKVIGEQEEGDVLVDLIKRKVDNTQVVVEDSSCSKFSIFIELNLSLSLNASGKVINDTLKFYHVTGEGRTARAELVNYEVINSRMFKVQVDVNKSLRISDYINNIFMEISPEKFQAEEIHKIAILTNIEDIILKVDDKFPVGSACFKSNSFDISNEQFLKDISNQIKYEYSHEGEKVTGTPKVSKESANSVILKFCTRVTDLRKDYEVEFLGTPVTGYDQFLGLPEGSYVKYGNEVNGYIILPKNTVLKIFQNAF